MSPSAQQTKSKTQQSPSDVYTALLGLAMLALGATIVVVVLRSLDYFDTIFKVLQAS